MLRVMLFEDNPNAKYIKALRSVYAGTDVLVDGSSSSTYLYDMAISKLDAGASYVYVYKDYVPNNSSSIDEYRMFCDKLIEKKTYDRIALIPIPCAEYFVLKLYEEISHSVIIKNSLVADISLEKQMKSMYMDIDCLYRKKKYGCRFWLDDCVDTKHLNISLNDKFVKLLLQLPVFLSGVSCKDIEKVNLCDCIVVANNICIQLALAIGADTEHCKEVLNMNPLLHIK